MQIVMAVDVDQRTELQAMIYDLEEENRWNFYKYSNEMFVVKEYLVTPLIVVEDTMVSQR